MSDDFRYQEKKLRNQSVNLAIKYATAILTTRGQLSVDEIGAIPFVTNETIRNIVIQALLNNLDVEVEMRRQPGPLHSDTVDVIKLRRELATGAVA